MEDIMCNKRNIKHLTRLWDCTSWYDGVFLVRILYRAIRTLYHAILMFVSII